MSKIDIRGLGILTREATELTTRGNLTSQEQRRFTLLTQQIALLRSGEVTLAELQQEDINEIQQRHGLPVTRAAAPETEERAKARAWQTLCKVLRENRTATETEGSLLSMIGTYANQGEFVPTEFLTEIYGALAAHDAFFDEDAVTVLNSKNGRVTQIPVYGDIENVATVIGESADSSSSEALVAAPSQVDSIVYSYRSPLWRLSIEVMQDAEMMGDAVSFYKRFAADRIARGVGADLAVGNGSGKPAGIVHSLIAAGVTPITAIGAAGNSGDNTQDGTNSIGSVDIAKVFYSVNKAYRASAKCAWFMDDGTLAFLAQLTNKFGNPLVQWQGPEAWILGKPVKISPSMDSIGAGKFPIVFGDGNYWLTRKVIDDRSYVQLVREASGLAEKGQMALRMFSRFGGQLLWNDSGSPAPFGYLQMHT
jgi:HK97 family phage major capsid protein